APQLKEILDNLNAQIAYAEETCDPLVHTGDLFDFVSTANIEFAREVLKNPKILYVAGNHEYYIGRGHEDNVYRMNSYWTRGLDQLGVNMFFTSRVVGSVNFVGIDDAYHTVEPWQLKRLRMEVEKGLPVILFVHAPLFEQKLFERSVEYWKDGSAYLVGCDEEHLMTYPEYLAVTQRPNEATEQFVEYVKREKRIKAVLAGHVHFNFESALPGGTMQYVTGRSHQGVTREITLL
ncbi:MAG: metallophosphoesterase, partial [Clostridia bacterium]|nr:metallophosphoesterase [Clostridia bacterium]